MRNHSIRKVLASALTLSLGLSLAACGGLPGNRSLESVHQPVVERTNFALDLTSGPGGLSLPEQRRLNGWFDAMDLRYGDRITIDDPMNSNATRGAVEAVAGRYGMLVGDNVAGTAGMVGSGTVRVIVTRAKAYVPGCPDWGGKSDFNPNNATSKGYGCATNGNLAAMVADPEHLIHGAEAKGETVIMSSTKAIQTYRDAKPTGEGGLKAQSSSGK